MSFGVYGVGTVKDVTKHEYKTKSGVEGVQYRAKIESIDGVTLQINGRHSHNLPALQGKVVIFEGSYRRVDYTKDGQQKSFNSLETTSIKLFEAVNTQDGAVSEVTAASASTSTDYDDDIPF